MWYTVGNVVYLLYNFMIYADDENDAVRSVLIATIT